MAPLNIFEHPEFSLAVHDVMRTHHRYTILVLYGNDCARRSLAASLTTSYTIVEAGDREEGLALVHQCAPDLIVTDGPRNETENQFAIN